MRAIVYYISCVQNTLLERKILKQCVGKGGEEVSFEMEKEKKEGVDKKS